jgi:hypothetical protein
MEFLKKLFEKKNTGQLILAILFIIYLVMNYNIPPNLASMINNTYGNILIIVIALLIFMVTNPIVGVLGFLVAYQMISSSNKYGLNLLQNLRNDYTQTEHKKWGPFTASNQFPYTLEQEMVKKMTPGVPVDSVNSPSSFKPILSNTNDAAPIHYNGVI